MASQSRLPAATSEIQDPGQARASVARSGWCGRLSQPPWIRVLLLPASVAPVGLSSEGQVLGVDIAGKSSLVQWISQVSTACPGSLRAFSHAFSGEGGVTKAQKTAFRSSAGALVHTQLVAAFGK